MFFLDIYRPRDTWRVYSVSGWPCRRGSKCRQNHVAGFWFCELEGGDPNTWDYCCRPDHQCGYSEGFSYPWCYVGPQRTQWRKCSDKYYPYLPDFNHHRPNYGHSKPHLTLSFDKFSPVGQGTNYVADLRPGARPNRPEAPPKENPPSPSLDEYEKQFDTQFTSPPNTGGMEPSRHWPVSYLHMEKPPNDTQSQSKFEQMKMPKSTDLNPKFAAIQNLIEIIKSNDLNNIKYQISNASNMDDDILFVKIPLPTNFTQETGTEKTKKLDEEFSPLLQDRRLSSSTTMPTTNNVSLVNKNQSVEVVPSASNKNAALYRRSYIERTNVTTHGKRSPRS